jgi:hypothetical protein
LFLNQADFRLLEQRKLLISLGLDGCFRFVIPVVVGSSPISHPKTFKRLAQRNPLGFLLSGDHVGTWPRYSGRP